MPKIVITMELRPRQGDIARAAKTLGVSHQAVAYYIRGQRNSISRDKAQRIVIKKAPVKES